MTSVFLYSENHCSQVSVLFVIEYHVEVNSRRNIICGHWNYSDLITCFATLNALEQNTNFQLSCGGFLSFQRQGHSDMHLIEVSAVQPLQIFFYLQHFLIPCGRSISVSLVLKPGDSCQSDISLSKFLFQVSNLIFLVPLELSAESSIPSVDCNLLISSFPFKYLKVLNGHFLAFLSLTAAEAWT